MQINYIPYVLKETDEFKALTSTLDYINANIEKDIADLKNNQYILDSTVGGIARYEKMVNVTPLDSDTLNDRRFRVMTKYNQQLPYTERSLRNLLDTLVGNNGYTLEIDHLSRRIIVRVELTAKSMFKTVGALLESYVPLNMIIDLSLLYNQYLTVEKLTHEQLEQFTQEQIREEALIDGDRNN